MFENFAWQIMEPYILATPKILRLYYDETIFPIYLNYLLPAYNDYIVGYPRIAALSGMIMCLFVVRGLWSSRMKKIALEDSKRKATLHRQQQRSKIEAFLKANPRPTNYQEILLLDSIQLVAAMKRKRFSCQQVLLTFCHEAASVHESLNCLTEIMFETALVKAASLDDNGVDGDLPLYGLPISVKDNIDVEGYASSIGLISQRAVIRGANSRIIEELLAAGAIPFCKTNVPQTLMSFECSNPLWGRTKHPLKDRHTPGGSSGGECALVAAGGSPLGIGNDIGGSLRIPAAFCGLCTLKASADRIPSSGTTSMNPSSLLIKAVNGPIAKKVAELAPVLDVLMCREDLNIVPAVCSFGDLQDLGRSSMHSPPSTLSMATRPKPREGGTRMKRFGIFYNNGFVGCTPATLRAVKVAEDALQAAGHQTVLLKMPFPIIEAVKLFYGCVAADSGHFYRLGLEGEPVEEWVQPFFKLMSYPRWMMSIFEGIAGSYGDPRPSHFINAMKGKTAAELKQMQALRETLQRSMLKLFKSNELDALIAPSFATPALLHSSFVHTSFAASYTFIWNILDFVAGTLPVCSFDSALDALPTIPLNEQPASDENPLEGKRLLEVELEDWYRAAEMEGLPLGVQVITPQYKEADCLHAMACVESAVADHKVNK